jgi:integrase
MKQRALSTAGRRLARRLSVEIKGVRARRRRRLPSPFASTGDRGLSRWISDWLADLAAREYRPRTLSTYGKALARLTPQLVAGQNAAELVLALAQLKPATRSLYLNAARSFDKWCMETGRTSHLALADSVRIKLDAAAPRPLDRAEGARREAASKARGGGRRIHWRTRFLYLLLRETGIRIGEALALRWRDVVLDAGREGLRLRTTKGRADRFVPLLPGELLSFLRRQSARDQESPNPLLAANPNGGASRPWSYSAALRAWRLLCERAGVTAVPHQLRHTRATELVKQGASTIGLQHAMGWRKIDQATKYVRFDDEDLRAELRRLDEDNPRPRAAAPRPNKRRR